MGGHPVFSVNSAVLDSPRATFNPMALPGVIWDNDEWNIFLNPAQIHNYRFRLTANSSRDSLFHGGGFVPYNNFVFGLYVNRRADFQLGQPGATFLPYRSISGPSVDFAPRYPVEFFAGVDYGVKWGVKLAWARRNEQVRWGFGRDAFDVNSRYWRIDSGIEFFGLEVFGGTTLSARYQDTSPAQVTQRLEQGNAGASFLWNETLKSYFVFNQQRETVDLSNVASGLPAEAKMRSWALGASYDWRPLYELRILPHIGLWYGRSWERRDPSFPARPGSAVDVGYDGWAHWVVPADLLVEYDATSWMKLMFGLSYDVVNIKHAQADPDNSQQEATISQRFGLRPRLGAVVNWDSLKTEFSLGRGTNQNAVNAQSLRPEQGFFGFTSQLYMAASASYSF